MTHLIILRELMINSRRKQVNMMAEFRNSNNYTTIKKALFDKERQRQISRDVEYVEFLNNEKIITGHQILYDREKFGIFNQIAFYREMSRDIKEAIIHAFYSDKHKIPFRSQLSFYKLIYLWWLNLPFFEIIQTYTNLYN